MLAIRLYIRVFVFQLIKIVTQRQLYQELVKLISCTCQASFTYVFFLFRLKKL